MRRRRGVHVDRDRQPEGELRETAERAEVGPEPAGGVEVDGAVGERGGDVGSVCAEGWGGEGGGGGGGADGLEEPGVGGGSVADGVVGATKY